MRRLSIAGDIELFCLDSNKSLVSMLVAIDRISMPDANALFSCAVNAIRCCRSVATNLNSSSENIVRSSVSEIGLRPSTIEMPTDNASDAAITDAIA